jgi:hypothetical protein
VWAWPYSSTAWLCIVTAFHIVVMLLGLGLVEAKRK